MGDKQEDRVQGSGEPREVGHCSCGRDTTKVESGIVPQGVAVEPEVSHSLGKQIGGQHYKTLAIQPITYIMANDLGWCEGNAVKYITRFKQKGGRQDIEKAIHYLQILLDSLE